MLNKIHIGGECMKNKILVSAIIFVMIISISSLLGGCQDKSESQTTDQSQSSQTNESQSDGTAKAPVWGTGTFLVGTDIQSGLYRATLTDKITKMGYIERSSDVSMSMEDIIANINLTGNGYVTIKDTDVAVRINGVELSQLDLSTLEPNIQDALSDGIYLVGFDIAPGTYKVDITDTVTNMGYVERLSDASMDLNNIIANEVFQGPGYVKIMEGDFAVRVQGATLTLQ